MSRDMMAWMSMELIGSVDVSWQDFGSQVGQITADFCHTLTTNLTRHDTHGPDDQPKTIDYHHLGMSRYFYMPCCALITNLTQHDSHGPDDQLIQ
jgi:hypothetical protein